MSDTRSPQTDALPLPRQAPEDEAYALAELPAHPDHDLLHDLSAGADLAREDVGRPARGRGRILGVVAAVLLLLGVAVAAFVMTRPITASFEVSASADTVVTTQSVTVTGLVRPADPLRTVTLEEQQPDGTWVSAGLTTQPDAAGRFTVAVSPSASGQHTYRVSTGEVDRVQAASSGPLTVTALQTATANAEAPKAVDVGGEVVVRGSVAPATAGRTVVLERSTDEAAWVGAEVRTMTAADGSYALTAPAPAAGTWKFRAAVPADDTFAPTTSPAVTVTVEDVKAAGEHYLATVAPSNKAGQAWTATLDDNGSSLQELTGSARAYATATKAFVDDLSGYQTWPQDVKPLIDEFVAGLTVEYGDLNTMAASDSLGEFRQNLMSMPQNTELGSLAEQIRQKLDLPARPIT